MIINRRTLLAAAPALIACSAFAEDASTTAPAALTAYERDTGGRVGVYAENLTTGARIAWRADERFVMCSTFKASLAALMLARIDRGVDRIDQTITYEAADLLDYAPVARAQLGGGKQGRMSIGDMCKATVELSDNTCANLLLAHAGGPASLTAFWRTCGDGVSRLDHNEPELNRSKPGDLQDTTTPAAMAGTVRSCVLGDILKPVSRTQLTDWMVNCKTGAKRLRAGLPPSWIIGDKTGSNGQDASGDIAVAWSAPDRPVLIAAYTQGGSPTTAQTDAVFKAIGEMVGQRLS